MPGKQNQRPSRFLSKTKLREAWETARRQGKRFSTPGIDNISGREFHQNLDYNLSSIASKIRDGSFRFSSLRSCWVPKKNNQTKLRLICIPTVQDRLVQRAIVAALAKNDRLGLISNVSFGFHVGRGVNDAISRATELRQTFRWVLKTDISSFFDKIQRHQLIEKLEQILPASLFPLVVQSVHMEVKTKSQEDELKIQQQGIIKGVGLRQGMPLSPLLSNVELKSFDKRVVRSKMSMVRYADDLAFFFSSQREAREAEITVKGWLAELGHTIPDISEVGKTRIYSPEESADFLGIEITFDNSTNCYMSKISNSSIKQIFSDLRQMATLNNCRKEHWTLGKLLQSMNSKIAGYSAVYRAASNHVEFQRQINAVSQDAMRSLFDEVFGKGTVDRLSKKDLLFLGLEESL